MELRHLLRLPHLTSVSSMSRNSAGKASISRCLIHRIPSTRAEIHSARGDLYSHFILSPSDACHQILTRDTKQQALSRGYSSDNGIEVQDLKTVQSQKAVARFKNTKKHALSTGCSLGNGIEVHHVKTVQRQKDLQKFWEMNKSCLKPDGFSFVHALKACAELRNLSEGRRVHAEAIASGFVSDQVVCNCLIEMYAKCGQIFEAKRVFHTMPARSVVSWSVMMMGLMKCGKTMEALELYAQMQHEQLKVDTFIYAGALKACSGASALEEGMLIHQQLIRNRLSEDLFLGNCLIDMYIKCNRIGEACRMFNNLFDRDVVSWSTAIGAFLKQGELEKALGLFQQMQEEGIRPNAITYVAVLNACANLGALDHGRLIHSQLNRRGLGSDKYVGSCLIDMYSKCGSVHEARTVFDSMHTRDVVVWGSMCMAYAVHGLAKEALILFEQMCQEGVKMDKGSFIPLLLAFSHAGMVDEAHSYFESLTCIYGIHIAIEHYSCMVDLLGRVGLLDEAENFTLGMSIQPDVCVWRSLLNFCRVHGKVEIGERAAKRILKLDPQNDSGLVLLSNMYADSTNGNG